MRKRLQRPRLTRSTRRQPAKSFQEWLDFVVQEHIRSTVADVRSNVGRVDTIRSIR